MASPPLFHYLYVRATLKGAKYWHQSHKSFRPES